MCACLAADVAQEHTIAGWPMLREGACARGCYYIGAERSCNFGAGLVNQNTLLNLSREQLLPHLIDGTSLTGFKCRMSSHTLRLLRIAG